MTDDSPDRAAERALRRHADAVGCALEAQDAAWGTGGWTRRRFLAGAGMVGAAALGAQLVTTRAAFAATPRAASPTNTLVVVFLRGAADGLRILSPHSSDLGLTYLREVRPGLVLPSPVPLVGGWALNPALAPLHDLLWGGGELAFVPGVSTPGVSRSHFQAQQYLEKGGSDSATTGWLDRALAGLGAGTTFRAVSLGAATPLSLIGAEPSVAMERLDAFTLPGWDSIRAASRQAIDRLYRNLPGQLGEDVPAALAAVDTAVAAQAGAGVRNGAVYPGGDFAQALQDLATLLRAEVGMQVATVDVGGWDTHTAEAGDLDGNLAATAQALAAFMTDLGPARRSRVTVVVMTEFGRRVEMNASGGTDHGHGSVMWLLGGGLSSSTVAGRWRPLSAGSLDQGDVPGVNNPFDVLGELLQKRLSAGSLAAVFPGHTFRQLGVATAV